MFRPLTDLAALDQPELSQAPAGFWRDNRVAVVALAARQPDVRGVLLTLFPWAIGQEDFTDEWLDLLAAAGATALLTGDAGLPVGEPARWLGELLRARTFGGGPRRRSTRLIDLVTAMAGRLRADGVGVGKPHRVLQIDIDADVLDLCAALDVPFVERRMFGLLLRGWLGDDSPGRRDLVALAAHPHFTGLFRHAAWRLLPDGHQPRVDELDPLVAVPAITAGIRSHLADLDADLDTSTVTTLREHQQTLACLCSPAGYARFPELAGVVDRTDPARALAATLRTGLFAEFTWPLYEQTWDRLAAEGQGDVDVDVFSWPMLIVRNRVRAVVIGPDGVMAEHEFRLPAGHRADTGPHGAWASGRLLVWWWQHDTPHTRVGYWTDDPDTLVTSEGQGGPPEPIEGWARQQQTGPFPDVFNAPAMGPLGAKGGLRIDPAWSTTPFGQADGYSGHRILPPPAGSTIERLDGRKVTVADRPLGLAAGAILVPGDDLPRMVPDVLFTRLLLSPDGTRSLWQGVDPRDWKLPIGWWHALTPRDPAGSADLRALTNDTARQLINAVAGDPDPVAAVTRLLPTVTAPRLVAAVAAEVVAATALADDLAAMRRVRNDPEPAPFPSAATDRRLLNGLSGLIEMHLGPGLGRLLPPYQRVQNPAGTDTFDVMHRLARRPLFAARPGTQDRRGVHEFDWPDTVPWLGAVALRAAMCTTPADERDALAAFLDSVAGTGLLDPDRAIRLVVAHPVPFSVVSWHQVGQPIATPHGAAYVVMPLSNIGVRLVEYSDQGTFGDIPGFGIDTQARPGGWGTESRVRQFLNLARTRPPVTWRPQLVGQLATAAGVDEPTAAMLLTGMLYIQTTGTEFIDPAIRATIGLSEAEALAARDHLAELPVEVGRAVIDAGMPHDPRMLWNTGPDITRMAQAWREQQPT